MGYRVRVTTHDGQTFTSPRIDDGLTPREAEARLTDTLLSGDLPDWLKGKVVDPAELESWFVSPTPGYKPPRRARPAGGLREMMAVWADAEGFVATPIGGPLAGNLRSRGATEREALHNAARSLDVLRGSRSRSTLRWRRRSLNAYKRRSRRIRASATSRLGSSAVIASRSS